MRYLFGLSPADVTVEQVGEDMKLRPGSEGTVWDARSGGTRLTDLTDLTSVPATTVTSDSNSVIGFYGPDGISSLYVDFGYDERYLMSARDLDAVSSVNGYSGTVVLAAADLSAVPAAEKAAASGVATLGSDAKVPVEQIPDMSATYVAMTQKNAASGVAGLDASSKLTGSQQLYSATGTILSVGSANAAGSANSAARGDHVHAGVTSVNGSQGAVSVTPASISAVATTVVGAASGVASLDSGTKVPVAQIPDLSATYTSVANYGNVWAPNDHGLIAWTLDPACSSSNGTQLSAGYIYLMQVILRSADTISNLTAVIGIGGATLTSGQCLAGLYSSTGTRRALTANMSTTWNSAGDKSMSLTSSYNAPAGKYYVALLFNGTTSPYFACGSTFGSNFTPGNDNLSAGSYRFGRSPAAGNTSLPTSITLSGYTPDANNIYAGVA
ncbi:hypothetical protein OG210_21830 [Streptomyces sp. NBC_00466]|uniref:hypothetical protein n=1 Tax=Streptomyces sp. NBC_00466 TaxID=2903655 RepID=UPI0030E198DD